MKYNDLCIHGNILLNVDIFRAKSDEKSVDLINLVESKFAMRVFMPISRFKMASLGGSSD